MLVYKGIGRVPENADKTVQIAENLLLYKNCNNLSERDRGPTD